MCGKCNIEFKLNKYFLSILKLLNLFLNNRVLEKGIY